MDIHQRNEKIKDYFYKGYSANETSILLQNVNHIMLSDRQVRRILAHFGLRKRHPPNQEISPEALSAIQAELSHSGQVLGYRSMQQRLLFSHGIFLSRENVLNVQNVLDPEGVKWRRAHKLSRRVYHNKGPNFLIHIDGYDKLKRYGFAIHGAVDGFSRQVLWLEVGRTNNNPRVVATYFLNYIQEIQGVPRCVRMDAGTENVLIKDIQKAFRWDHIDNMAKDKSVIIGSSHCNQRVERQWRSCKELGIQYFIDLFKDKEAQGLIDVNNGVHIELLRFCFLRVIANELNIIKEQWNAHRMRPCHHSESLSGKPCLLYHSPTLFGTIDYKTAVQMQDVDNVRHFCSAPSGCDPVLEVEFLSLLRHNGKSVPLTVDEAANMFIWFKTTLHL